MFPPIANGASGQSPDGMFLDPAERAAGTGITPASGTPGQQGQAPVDPDEPKLMPGQTERDLYEKRKAHWQSKVDKVTHEAKQLKEALEAERDAIAIGRLAMKNPQVLQGLNATQSPPAPVEEKPPEPPAKPDSFNETEAYSNPESESWKHRKKEEHYQREKIAYLERRDAKRDEALKQLREQGEAEARERTLQAQTAQLLQAKYNYSPEEIPSFLQMLHDPPTMDDLVVVHRYRQRQSRQAGPPMNQPNHGGNAPPPPPVIRQGVGQPAHTIENAFGANLIRATSGR